LQEEVKIPSFVMKSAMLSAWAAEVHLCFRLVLWRFPFLHEKASFCQAAKNFVDNEACTCVVSFFK